MTDVHTARGPRPRHRDLSKCDRPPTRQLRHRHPFLSDRNAPLISAAAKVKAMVDQRNVRSELPRLEIGRNTSDRRHLKCNSTARMRSKRKVPFQRAAYYGFATYTRRAQKRRSRMCLLPCWKSSRKVVELVWNLSTMKRDSMWYGHPALLTFPLKRCLLTPPFRPTVPSPLLVIAPCSTYA